MAHRAGQTKKPKKRTDQERERRRALLELPQENILYFLEKTAPRLRPWQREVLRIVRLIAQYFYPQTPDQGDERGLRHLRPLRDHEPPARKGADHRRRASWSSCTPTPTWCSSPSFDDPRYSGINPYALGFAMMQDIERICVSPEAEDRQWFPDIAGNNDPVGTLKDVWANYRDESFILQFLSPHIIRKLGLFHVVDDHREKELAVDAIHNERGYTKVRRALARHYDVSRHDPDIQIVDVDLEGDRRLELRHQVVDGVTLEEDDAERVLQHLANLWGYEVYLIESNGDGELATKHHAEPLHPFM